MYNAGVYRRVRASGKPVPISTVSVIPLPHGQYRSQVAEHAVQHGPWPPNLVRHAATAQSVLRRCTSTLADMNHTVTVNTAGLPVQGGHLNTVPYSNKQ